MEKKKSVEQENKKPRRIGFDESGKFQERRKILNLLVEIPKQEKHLQYHKLMLVDMRTQVKINRITMKNTAGKVITKNQLQEMVEAQEFNHQTMEKGLSFLKEDLYHLIQTEDLAVVKKEITGHYKFIDIESKKIREEFKDVV